MTTLTLQIPDALAEQIRAAAAAEGKDINNYAVARLNDLFVTEETEEDPEVIAALQEAIDDYEKGDRGQPFEEFMAEMDAKYGPVPTRVQTK